MKTIRATGLAVAAALVLAGCATVRTPTRGDPLERLNRTVFTFNDKVDQYALKPVAQAYVRALPQPVQDSVTNFFSNIGDVYTAANDLLQLKITDGVEDVMRVAINTVFGVGGLFDVATIASQHKHTGVRSGRTVQHSCSRACCCERTSGRLRWCWVDRPRSTDDAAGTLLQFAEPTAEVSGIRAGNPGNVHPLQQKS